MRRFFTMLFVLSLVATAATVYWRTYLPEGSAPAASERSFSPGQPDGGGPTTRSYRESARMPSERQDMAVTISILSSVISALAAVVQTWLTARAFRR